MRLKLVTEGAEFRGRRGVDHLALRAVTPDLFPRFSVFFRAFRDQQVGTCEAPQ